MKRSHDTLHRTGFFLFSEKRATIEAEGNLPGNEEYRERLIGVISYSTKTQPKRQPARRYSHPTAEPPNMTYPETGTLIEKTPMQLRGRPFYLRQYRQRREKARILAKNTHNVGKYQTTSKNSRKRQELSGIIDSIAKKRKFGTQKQAAVV